MCEMKFRLWDNDNHEYFKVGFGSNIAPRGWQWFNIQSSGEIITGVDDDVDEPAHKDRFLLEQFTGLKDKNGKKEVYKGDIALDDNGDKWVMEWDDECACFCLVIAGKTLDSCGGDEILYARAVKAMEIIGDIHTNPELLKGEIRQ